MNQNTKTLIGFAVLTLGLVVSLLAQANIPVPPLPAEGQANIFTAMYDTIIHNPSSLFVLIVLCVFAWLMDTLPFINSQYVTHYSTLLGGAIYWMFCHPANVPKTFPYAWPVLACIGCVCGFVAGVLHKQIIGRALEWAKSKIPGSDPKPETKLPLLLLCGALAVGSAGCSTVQPETRARIESAAKLTAYIGSSEYLRAHPETRPAFVLARDELTRLSTAEQLDFPTLLAVVDRLPVKELKSERTQLIVTSATLLLSDYAGALPVERLKELQPLAAALAAGLDLGLKE